MYNVYGKGWTNLLQSIASANASKLAYIQCGYVTVCQDFRERNNIILRDTVYIKYIK